MCALQDWCLVNQWPISPSFSPYLVSWFSCVFVAEAAVAVAPSGAVLLLLPLQPRMLPLILPKLLVLRLLLTQKPMIPHYGPHKRKIVVWCLGTDHLLTRLQYCLTDKNSCLSDWERPSFNAIVRQIIAANSQHSQHWVNRMKGRSIKGKRFQWNRNGMEVIADWHRVSWMIAGGSWSPWW